MEIDQEILDEFHTEADESLDTLEQDLIKLESVAEEGNTDGELVDRIFRVLHTLKGGAGFLGLDKMNKLAHAGENLLDEVRGGHVAVTTEVMNALLETNDNLKELLECSKTGASPDSVDFSELLGRLEVLSNSNAAPTSPVKEPENEVVDASIIEESEEEAAPTDGEKTVEGESLADPSLLAEVMGDDKLGGAAVEEDEAGKTAESVEDSLINADLLEEIMGDDRLGGAVPTADEEEEDNNAAAPEAEAPSSLVNEELLAEIQNDDRLGGKSGEEDGIAPEAPEKKDVAATAPSAATPQQKPAVKQPQQQAAAASRRDVPEAKEVTIRVDTARLDAVMNLVGELVLARNGLHRQMFREDIRTRLSGSSHLSAIDSGLEALTRVSKALQMSVLHTRMQPIKRVFDKIPRQVRELKNKLRKDIELIIEGEGTEVDRSLVEELSDPMVHLIRNALDHGLEGPEERERMGKDTTGTLIVRAFYEGNNVVIQVADDGRGIDAEIVKNKAVEKGLITQEQADQMTETQAQRLIMAPGFSTAKEVSDVSGRGVGMDVVSNKINKMNGTIDLESELGMGTTVSIYLPLTLAIVQALIVGANNEGFAIPIGSISEVIKFSPEDVHQVNGEDVIELRQEVVPIRYLAELTRTGKRPRLLEEMLTGQKPVALEDKTEKPAQTAAKAPEENTEPTEDTKAKQPEQKPVKKDTEKTAKVPEGEKPKKEEKAEAQKKKQRRTSSSTGGYIIIVRDSNMIMGLVVDELIGQEEAVVKSITDAFEFNPAISGATISGDGHVHMILDVPYFMRETVKNKHL